MAEPVIYIRGFPGTGAFEAADPEMLADLALIGELPEARVANVSALLRQATGFLNTESLREKVKAAISDEKAAQAVFRALNNLEPEDVDRVLKQVEHARRSEKKPRLDDAKMATLRRNLPALVQLYPALARFEKARRLATLTSQRLDSLDLICDLRPIFDKEGQQIEGIFPFTRLRLVATGADGLPRDFEAELSTEQVHQLLDKVKRAKQKLSTLRVAIEAWVPGGIPDMAETRVPADGD